MEFATAMELLQQSAPDFVTEVTPINANEAKKEFFSMCDGAPPSFVYDDDTDCADGKRRVEELLAKFKQEGFSDIQLEILDDFGAQAQLKYDLLQAIRDFRQTKEEASRAEARQRILQYSVALHGEPDRQVYHALWAERLAEIEQRFTEPKWAKTLRIEDGEKFCYLLDLFESSTRVDEEQIVPHRATIMKFRDFCWKRWQKVFERVEMDKIYTPEEVCELLNTVLREDFPYPVKWRAVISENKTSLNTNQKTEEIEIPRYRGKGPYTGKVVLEIILGHELMVHVNRREYAKVYYPDVAVPLPNYLEFEEGLAKAVEQALGGEPDQTGVDHYLTAGMAYYDGLDFTEIFTVHSWQLFLLEIEPGDTVEMREQKRQKTAEEAFRLTLRCLRGTGAVPLMNNLVYYNGQIRAWRYIEERIDQPERLEKILFRSGKTDPTNPLHQKMLESLGWTAEDF